MVASGTVMGKKKKEEEWNNISFSDFWNSVKKMHLECYYRFVIFVWFLFFFFKKKSRCLNIDWQSNFGFRERTWFFLKISFHFPLILTLVFSLVDPSQLRTPTPGKLARVLVENGIMYRFARIHSIIVDHRRGRRACRCRHCVCRTGSGTTWLTSYFNSNTLSCVVSIVDEDVLAVDRTRQRPHSVSQDTR